MLRLEMERGLGNITQASRIPTGIWFDANLELEYPRAEVKSEVCLCICLSLFFFFLPALHAGFARTPLHLRVRSPGLGVSIVMRPLLL